jgi:thiol-disulfide isomerase/thioredoxin
MAAAEEFTVGSKAPPLDVEHWIHDREGAFGPVTEFQPGKVYVIEFWATWCGPCIASMPHLAQLQDDFADRGVTIISVSDEDPAKIDAFLDREAGPGKTFRDVTKGYCLTTDPDRSVSRDYMQAAGESGIPTAFVVGKTGIVEWIGHPMQIDKPLEKIVAGTWDRSAYAAEKREMATVQAKLAGLGRLLRGKDPQRAVALVDEVIADAGSDGVKERLRELRGRVEAAVAQTLVRQALARGGAEGVEAFGRMVAAAGDSVERLNEAAWLVVELAARQDDVGPELLAAAAAAAEKAVGLDPENGPVLDTLAHLQAAQGDIEKAIRTQRRALEHAGPAAADIRRYLEELEEKRK